ncbi:acyltransferase [Patescibacteria group bacterium]|nr:acyltransferase [Patescibacteria group bacterium]
MKAYKGTDRDLTDYLKGLAIIAVVVSHFQNALYGPEVFSPFGNHFIAIFFIFSGYGLFFSLERLQNNYSDTKTILRKFYYKRAIRLYPLFWLKFLADLIFDPKSKLGFHSIPEFLLVNFHKPKILWFLTALVPCYLIAPFLFFLLKKYKLHYLLWLIILFILVNFVFSAINVPRVRIWAYRELFLSHILLFALGMSFPLLSKTFKIKANKTFSVILFLFMLFTFFQTSNFPLLKLTIKIPFLFETMFIISTSIFCFYFSRNKTWTPLFSTFKILGAYSFSIYLFHGVYISLLYKLHIIEKNLIISYLPFLSFFPIFLFVCIFTENIKTIKFNFNEIFKKTSDEIKTIFNHQKDLPD